MNRISIAIGLMAIAGCGDDSHTVPKLMKMLEDADASKRCMAVHTLATYGPEARPAVRLLTDALKDKDASVCIGAAYALAAIGPDAAEALPSLIDALKSNDTELRLASVYAISCVGLQSSTALPALQPLLQDRDPRIRDEVALGMRKLNNAMKYRSVAPPSGKG